MLGAILFWSQYPLLQASSASGLQYYKLGKMFVFSELPFLFEQIQVIQGAEYGKGLVLRAGKGSPSQLLVSLADV